MLGSGEALSVWEAQDRPATAEPALAKKERLDIRSCKICTAMIFPHLTGVGRRDAVYSWNAVDGGR